MDEHEGGKSIEFTSALDWWLFPSLLLLPAVACFGLGACSGEPLIAVTVGVGFGGILAGLVGFLTRRTTYTLSDRYLTISSGGLETIIDYAWIKRIEATRSLMLAPCRSIERVRITFDHGTVMVSPPDREAFISELDARCQMRRQVVARLLT